MALRLIIMLFDQVAVFDQVAGLMSILVPRMNFRHKEITSPRFQSPEILGQERHENGLVMLG